MKTSTLTQESDAWLESREDWFRDSSGRPVSPYAVLGSYALTYGTKRLYILAQHYTELVPELFYEHQIDDIVEQAQQDRRLYGMELYED